MKNKDSIEVFRSASIPSSVLKNTIPAMAAMVMVLIYNLADTFFIGQIHNALMVSAVSLASPVFLIFMAIGSIFGIGGTSVISRAMGEGRTDKAKKVSAFCMWGSMLTGIVFMAVLLIFMDPILKMIGASEDSLQYTREYLRTIAIAGPFVIISNCFANIIRTEGKATTAIVGQLIGNFLNIILDPIMILGFGWNVTGAALATAVANVVSAVYYLTYFKWGKSILGIHPKDFTIRDGIMSGVLSIGIPAAMGDALMSLSGILINGQMAKYGDMAVAGIGIAMKVTMITGILFIGFGQGVQPLLGYCVGARDWARFKQFMKFSVVLSFVLSTVITTVCYLFTNQIVSAFLTDSSALEYAVSFARILLTTSFLFGVFYVLSNALQAMGAASFSMIINLSRQGLIYIPALYVLHGVIGINGLVWAQPVADVLSLVMVIVLYAVSVSRLMEKDIQGTDTKYQKKKFTGQNILNKSIQRA